MTNRHCSDDDKEQLRKSIELLGMTDNEFLRRFAAEKRIVNPGAEVGRLRKPLQTNRNLSEFDFKQLWDFSEKLHREKKTGYVARRAAEGVIIDQALLDAVKAVSIEVGAKLQKKLAD